MLILFFWLMFWVDSLDLAETFFESNEAEIEAAALNVCWAICAISGERWVRGGPFCSADDSSTISYLLSKCTLLRVFFTCITFLADSFVMVICAISFYFSLISSELSWLLIDYFQDYLEWKYRFALGLVTFNLLFIMCPALETSFPPWIGIGNVCERSWGFYWWAPSGPKKAPSVIPIWVGLICYHCCWFAGFLIPVIANYYESVDASFSFSPAAGLDAFLTSISIFGLSSPTDCLWSLATGTFREIIGFYLTLISVPTFSPSTEKVELLHDWAATWV